MDYKELFRELIRIEVQDINDKDIDILYNKFIDADDITFLINQDILSLLEI